LCFVAIILDEHPSWALPAIAHWGHSAN